jgi:hypothetical protein
MRFISTLHPGERNQGTFWAACRAAEDGTLPLIEADLTTAATARGLSEREVRRVVASAARTVSGARR